MFKEVAGCRIDAFGFGADTLGIGYYYYIFMTIIFYFLHIQLSLSNFPDDKVPDFRTFTVCLSHEKCEKYVEVTFLEVSKGH